MKKVILVFSFVSFAVFSCEQEQISSQGPASSRGSKYMSPAVASGIVADLPPEMPDGGTLGGDLTFYPPQSPAIFNATPFVPSGQASSSFSSTGGFTTDAVAFGPAEGDVFPFVPPTGAAKVWMGFIFDNQSGPSSKLLISGYPIAISNSHAYWFGGPLTRRLVAAGLGNGLALTWIPAHVGDNNQLISGHYDYYGSGMTTSVTDAQVTITELSINSQDRLTLKATVKIGSSTYQVNKTNYIRVH
jgi:hypothetical protein